MKLKISIFVLLVVAIATGGYFFYVTKFVRGPLKEARSALSAGQLDVAKNMIDTAIRRDQDNPEVYLVAARVARLRQEYDQTESYLNRCNKLQNGASEASQIEFLLMRAQTGEADEVGQILLSYVRKDHPESKVILETLARSYMHHLRYGPANYYLSLTIEKFPEEAQPYHWRGWVLERMNLPKDAMVDYKKSLELDPALSKVRLRVCEMLLEDHKLDEAVENLEILQKQIPEKAEFKARLGHCRFLQNKPEEARQLLEEAEKELNLDSTVLILLGRIAIQDKDPVKAEQLLKKALKIDQADTEAQYALVNALQLQKKHEEASKVLQDYEKHKQLLDRANKLLQSEAKSPTQDPNQASEVGSMLLSIGQDRLGLYWLDQAINRDANHQPSHKALAEYYEKKGEPEKAAIHRRKLKDEKSLRNPGKPS